MDAAFDFLFENMLSDISVTDAAVQVLGNYVSRDKQESRCKTLIRRNNMRVCKYLLDLREACRIKIGDVPPPKYIMCDIVRLHKVYCEKAEEYASPIVRKVTLKCDKDEIFVPVDINLMERIFFNGISYIAAKMNSDGNNKIVIRISETDDEIYLTARTRDVHCGPYIASTNMDLPMPDGAFIGSPHTGEGDSLSRWLIHQCVKLLNGFSEIKITEKGGLTATVRLPKLPESALPANLRESVNDIYHVSVTAARYFYGLAD